MKFERSSGILLHPTSLPGPFGIGTLGKAAYRFIDFLAAAGQRLWQVCPLGPTGFGNSPYQCFSAFGGNPLLIDLEALRERGWLTQEDLQPDRPFPADWIDYERVIAFVWPRLKRARRGFLEHAASADREAFEGFCEQQATWLDDYALFMAIKEQRQGQSWNGWDDDLRLRKPAALERARKELADEIADQRFAQWIFFEQWLALKQHANAKSIKIIGDIPIYVAPDSADAWAHRELFQYDEHGRPAAVAGVPPDYFSATGQLWGNPLYDWKYHEVTGYAWWVENIRSKLTLYDMFRVDHFRGFAAYWAVPSDETTAINGRWQPGPGKSLFSAVIHKLGDIPLIAEDLGVITPDVEELRDHFGFPGMKILQFAFEATSKDEYRPHTYGFNSVVYTGTHDNDTVMGWHAKAKAHDRSYAEQYLLSAAEDIAWGFIRSAWASPAIMALAPLQDVLSLGSAARMNTPGTTDGNWGWRFADNALTAEIAQRLKLLSGLYCRGSDLLKKPQTTNLLPGA